MRKKVVLPESIKPREYQILAVESICDLIRSNPEKRHLFSAPTGTGKSWIELMVLAQSPDGLFITPRIEIIQGMLEKLNDFDEDESKEQTVDRAWQYGIITPIRLRNMLAKGLLPYRPAYLMIDEAHHHLAGTYQDIDMYLNGVPTVGLTATPYRGTPQGTRDFYAQWNDTVNVILSLPDAVRDGYCSMPTAVLLPMVDDDVISLTAGEFKVSAVDAVVLDRIKSLTEYSKRFWCGRSKTWDRPTMFSVSSSLQAHKLTSELNSTGVQAECVTQDTLTHERRSIFRRVINCQSCLVQIDVISEGVDLPIRRLIDIRPTMSPTKWVQQIGRIMRPVNRCTVCLASNTHAQEGQEYPFDCSCEPAPEYICCCRNLERHAYLMEGLFPNSTIKECQEMFEGQDGSPVYSKRSGSRAIGMEGLGKFVNTPVSLGTGLTVFTYSLVKTNEFQRTEYFAIVHPNNPQLVIGEKVSTKNKDTNETQWGKWKLVDSIPELKGCITAKDNPLTNKQVSYWNSSAEAKGLDHHQILTSRKFQILPFLRNTGISFS